MYGQIFHLLCLRRRFLTLEGTLETSSKSVDWELGVIRGHINFLEGTALRIGDDFNYVLRIADAISLPVYETFNVL